MVITSILRDKYLIVVLCVDFGRYLHRTSWIILSMGSANERRRYNVTSSLALAEPIQISIPQYVRFRIYPGIGNNLFVFGVMFCGRKCPLGDLRDCLRAQVFVKSEPEVPLPFWQSDAI